jgi:hypothetical protein
MRTILICACACLLFACTKRKKQDNLFIRGRLFLLDTIAQQAINQPLSGKTVRLAASATDSLNFIVTRKTDTAGYFLFDLPGDGKNDYYVRYDETVNGVHYTANAPAANAQDNVLLVATIDQSKETGILVYTRDASAGIMPASKLYIYNSQVLAALNDPNGVRDSLLTDANGRAFKLQYPAGTYYLKAIKKVGSTTFQGSGQVTVLSAGLQPVVITMQ